MEQKEIPFDIDLYLENQGAYEIVNQYGMTFAFVAYDPKAQGQNLILRRVDDNALHQFFSDGCFMSDRDESCGNLILREKFQTMVLAGKVWIDDNDIVVGLDFPQAILPSDGSKIRSLKATLIITDDPIPKPVTF